SYTERVQADFSGMGLTTGKHPMALARATLSDHIIPATSLQGVPHGARVSTAGAVICRQRPGTAKGVVFITLEDETGLSNAIVYANTFEEYRLTITTEAFLVITGTIQHAEGTTHVMAEHIEALEAGELPSGASHDFH
ncbi:MAG: OB-fold nucleic acid binding domain-containing protein, partial [Verrucomicrobiales bacterium]|nr:OB-fold nucleic acid binding domain-containing protein [Verrucomicrobiales bacterium]